MAYFQRFWVEEPHHPETISGDYLARARASKFGCSIFGIAGAPHNPFRAPRPLLKLIPSSLSPKMGFQL